jgi:protein involved in polysaccharide export with SLBB domain
VGTNVPELTQHPNLAPILDGAPVDEQGFVAGDPIPSSASPPSELAKVSLPRYRMAPPDILQIQAVRLFPKSPYYLQTSDFLQIVVPNALIDQPIASTYQVDSAGMVNLGPAYDAVKLEGLTLDEAHEAIAKHLSRLIDQPQVSVALLQASGLQQVAGEHLIGPDGYINLGVYGSVYVSGLTVDEARVAIEQKLSESSGNFGGGLNDNDHFGSSVTGIGDYNGDGIVDITAGAEQDNDGGTDRGAAWIMFMDSDGELISKSKVSSTSGNFAGPLADGDLFGSSLAQIGDLDADGTIDIAAGAKRDDDGGTDRGALWILFMQPSETDIDFTLFDDRE